MRRPLPVRLLRAGAAIAAVPYGLWLAYTTLLPLTAGEHRSNVVPFRTILDQARYAVDFDVFLRQIAGNIALFVPLGLVLGVFVSSAWRALALAAGVSAGIELLQLVIPGRSFDVDDVLLNVLGGMLGWCVGRALARAAAASRELLRNERSRDPSVPYSG